MGDDQFESSVRAMIEGLALSMLAHTRLHALRLRGADGCREHHHDLNRAFVDGGLGLVFAGNVSGDSFEIEAQLFDRHTGQVIGPASRDALRLEGENDLIGQKPSPGERLEDTLARLECGVRVPIGDGQLVASGIRGMNPRGLSSLMTGIGATRRGRNGSATGQATMARRNELIRRAYDAAADVTVSDRDERLARLVKAVAHVDAKLRFWRVRGGPDADSPLCYALLYEAASCGELPKSRKSLLAIVG